MTVAGDLADDYNGQQGDLWDAQKDMALAALGVLAGIVWASVRRPR
jgi:putative membrane protein